MGYALKAACSTCRAYGRIDDVTLICSNCGEAHAITDAECQQRDEDARLLAFAMSSRDER